MTPKEWLAKAKNLPLREAVRRVINLALDLPEVALRLNSLRRIVRQQGKTLHLLVLTEHLGDIVAGEPLVQQLARPDRFLVWVVRREYADMVRYHPLIDDVLEVTSCTAWRIISKIIFGIERSEFHVDRHSCGRFGLSLRFKNEFGIDNENYYHFGNILKIQGLVGLGQEVVGRPKIHLDPSVNLDLLKNKLELSDQEFIAFHCTSSDPARTWPAENFKKIAEWILQNTRFLIFEFGLEPVLQEGRRVKVLKSRFPLREQAAIFARAQFFVGGDSGFAHIANASRVRSVIVIAKFKNFTNHIPYSGGWEENGECVIVRTQSSIEDISPARVIEALSGLISTDL